MIAFLRRLWSALVRGDRAIDRLIRDYSREHLPVVGVRMSAWRMVAPDLGAYTDHEQVVELRKRAA